MSTAPQRSRGKTQRGFTLVEIMIVVVIIGLLAALAIPAFQRVQRASQNARIINDFRVFAQAFEIYNTLNGTWPNNSGGGAVPLLPVPMNNDFRVATWRADTVIGGQWNWDNSVGSGGIAGISISTSGAHPMRASDEQLAEIDAKIDDGDLTTGNFQRTSSSKITLILARADP